MRRTLLVCQSKSGEKVVELSEGLALFVGRTLECGIYLPSPSVSRKHAVFVMRIGAIRRAFFKILKNLLVRAGHVNRNDDGNNVETFSVTAWSSAETPP